MQEITEVNALKEIIQEHFIAVAVFTMPSCGVCAPLKKKIATVLEEFPEVATCSVDLSVVEAAKGEYQIYTAPIIGLFVDGKEAMRYSAAMDIAEFREAVKRYLRLKG
jgi:thioredoxin-like negative regulator of GroEL